MFVPKIQPLGKTEPVEDDSVVIKKSELQRMVNEIAEEKIASIRQEQDSMRMMGENRAKKFGDWSEVSEDGKKKYYAHFKLWRPDTDSEWGMDRRLGALTIRI